MKRTTIRELKHDTTTVLQWVADGETVEVCRRGLPVAVLSPIRPRARVAQPDFAGRLREIYGRKELKTTGTEVVSTSRGQT